MLSLAVWSTPLGGPTSSRLAPCCFRASAACFGSFALTVNTHVSCWSSWLKAVRVGLQASCGGGDVEPVFPFRHPSSDLPPTSFPSPLPLFRPSSFFPFQLFSHAQATQNHEPAFRSDSSARPGALPDERRARGSGSRAVWSVRWRNSGVSGAFCSSLPPVKRTD